MKHEMIDSWRKKKLVSAYTVYEFGLVLGTRNTQFISWPNVVAVSSFAGGTVS